MPGGRSPGAGQALGLEASGAVGGRSEVGYPFF